MIQVTSFCQINAFCLFGFYYFLYLGKIPSLPFGSVLPNVEMIKSPIKFLILSYTPKRVA